MGGCEGGGARFYRFSQPIQKQGPTFGSSVHYL